MSHDENRRAKKGALEYKLTGIRNDAYQLQHDRLLIGHPIDSEQTLKTIDAKLQTLSYFLLNLVNTIEDLKDYTEYHKTCVFDCKSKEIAEKDKENDIPF